MVGFDVTVRGGGSEDLGSLSGLYNGWMGVLAEGEYTLRVTHPDYQRLELPVEVGPQGGSRFLTARMRRKS